MGVYTSLSRIGQPVAWIFRIMAVHLEQVRHTLRVSSPPFSRISFAKSGYAKAIRPKPAASVMPDCTAAAATCGAYCRR